MIDRDVSYDSSNDSPPPLLTGAIANLSAARRIYTKLLHQKRLKSFEQLISDMEDLTHIGERVQMAFKYLKPIRRSLSSTSTRISLRDWHRDLQHVQGNSVMLIPEDDHFPLMKPPSHGDMLEVLSRMKNGKSPGLDLITVEMIKASPSLSSALYNFICNSYKTGKVPVSWQTTVSQPIPKKAHPQEINDYRKITLASVGYKVHASLLLQEIKPFLPQIGDYQSGFLPNRSCDDLIFVMKQVLDVRWNHGQSTYVLSLDLEKAFDTVDIHQLPIIFKQHGVPHYLINLLTVSSLHEQNCISWMGEKTASVNKSRGIKQGCPISPYLFNMIQDWVYTQLKLKLATTGLELFTAEKEKPLTLPMVLAYADDTSFLSGELLQLEQILTEFIPLLAEVGMKINVNKSGIVVKTFNEPPPPTHITLAALNFPVVKVAKILGVSITSSVNRKDYMRERCAGSIRLSKSLIPSLKKMRAPIEVFMRLYHSLICPSLIYGHKAGSMTNANRLSLMHRELTILRDLVSVARPVPSNISIVKLLDQRTINRKVSVHRIRYYGHIQRRHSDTLLQKAKQFRLTTKRRIGRPRFTFNDTLLHDLRKYPNVTTAAWTRSWKQVNDIKNLTSTIYSREDLFDDPMADDLMIYSSDDDERSP